MPEAYSAIGGIPLTATVRTARSHVVAHANKFVPIHGARSRAVGVDACNAAHVKYRLACEKPWIQFCRYSRTGGLSASAWRRTSGSDQLSANRSSPKINQVRSTRKHSIRKAAIEAGPLFHGYRSPGEMHPDAWRPPQEAALLRATEVVAFSR